MTSKSILYLLSLVLIFCILSFFFQLLAFCYRGGQGSAPQNDFCPPKRRFPPVKFSKNNRKNNRNNSLLFLKTMVYCLLPRPLILFQQKARLIYTCIKYHFDFKLDNSMLWFTNDIIILIGFKHTINVHGQIYPTHPIGLKIYI